MFRPKELFIGLRFARAKRREQYVSFAFIASILGVGLGVAALIVVLSVMNGFEKEMRERILGMTSHATITQAGDVLSDWQSLATQIGNKDKIIASAPYVQAEAMLSHDRNVSGALVRGIDPKEEVNVSDIGSSMIAGSLDDLVPGGYGIILGKELAQALGTYVGDKVTIITPQASVTPVGIMPRLRRFTVVGIFEVGMHTYDRQGSVIHLADAQRLFGYKEKVGGLRLKLENILEAPAVTLALATDMGPDFWVRDWTDSHSNFFKALQTERAVMIVILMMIVGVAAFNIITTLVMTVNEKQSDIAILRTIGMTPRSIMMVFIIQGSIIGLFGVLLGISVGVPLAINIQEIVSFLENFLGIDFLPAEIYYISELPSDLRIDDVIRYATSAFILTIIATIYPSWRASKTQPAEALRYD